LTDSPSQHPQSNLSQSDFEPIIVGKIVGTHGLEGGIRAVVISEVSGRFNTGRLIYILGQPYVISSSSPATFKSNKSGTSGPSRKATSSGDQIILQLQGLDSETSAKKLLGEDLTVPEAEAPQLPEGEYFYYQIVGLNVLTEQGEVLGSVSEILETGSNDVYVTSGGSGEILIPALASVILEIRLSDGVMVVSLPDGLR
jgi:16S rRNA processing protein RimM